MLAAVCEAGKPITLTEVARKTGLPKSTVHRLLAELHCHEVVARNANRYELGRAMRYLVASRGDDRRRQLCRVLKPLLIAVHVKTQYLVGLGVAAADSMVEFGDLAYSHEYVGQVEHIERASALNTSAAGKALLAHDPSLAVNLAMRWSQGSGSGALPGGLEAELRRIRRTGVAVNLDDAQVGIVAMAVPLFGASRPPVAALSIGAPRTRFDVTTARGVLRWASLRAHGLLRQNLAKV